MARAEAGRLAVYIWDNYISCSDFIGGIWLIGAGNAFDAVIKLLCEREESHTQVKGVIAFLTKETHLKSMAQGWGARQ